MNEQREDQVNPSATNQNNSTNRIYNTLSHSENAATNTQHANLQKELQEYQTARKDSVLRCDWKYAVSGFAALAGLFWLSMAMIRAKDGLKPEDQPVQMMHITIVTFLFVVSIGACVSGAVSSGRKFLFNHNKIAETEKKIQAEISPNNQFPEDTKIPVADNSYTPSITKGYGTL